MSDRFRRHPDRIAALILALMAYVPILLTRPGNVSADTKSYLTLDPSAVLRQAVSMWDPSVGAGTVPHQNIGYLFPLGPYYWLMEAIGSPDWLTQRLLWGTMVFAAAYGMYRMARWLGWTFTGALVAACAYGFSPYLLSYLARLSVILGPWAALPWMILLASKAARTRSWKPAAQFAVVVALVGSVNATSLVLAGLGPVIWLATDVACGPSPTLRGRSWCRQDRGAQCRRVGVVDRGAADPGDLRHPDPPVHRDLRIGCQREHPGRDRPRPRLLVLLRWRPTRPVGRTRRSRTSTTPH